MDKSDRERQIPHDLSHMWNLKTDRHKLIDTGNRLVLARGVGWGVGEMGEGGQKGKRETSFVSD